MENIQGENWKLSSEREPIEIEIPEEIESIFLNYCEECADDSVGSLRKLLVNSLGRLRSYETEFFGPNIKLAQEVVDRYSFLLDAYSTFEPEKKALVVGGIRYFALNNDAIRDIKPVTGLDDDVLVLNYVLYHVGLEDMLVGAIVGY